MRRSVVVGSVSLLMVAGTVIAPAATITSAAGPGGTRSIPAGGTTAIRPGVQGADGLQQPELRPPRSHQGEADSFNRARPGFKNGKFPKRPLDAPTVASSSIAGANPDLLAGVNGLTHRDQRLANGGNQFSLEPPDQALCVGNGYMLEGVNSVVRVRSAADGTALTGVQDINSFFGYPAAINRTTGAIGPRVIDPVCHYDPDSNRFIVVITTLHSLPNGDFTGRNTIDVAVSNTGDPTGTWTRYSVPAQNDGTEGTPNHGCTLDGVVPGPCFQDYPHIGGDRNGVYVTTNEYDLFGPNFNAAQVFAFSKSQLAAHPASINVTLIENLAVDGSPGFTVWPATSPAGQYSSERNGTEYLLSTIAGDGSETGNPTGTARRIGMWAITNTASLNSASPALEITSRLTNSETYVYPPTSDQQPGDIPLGECVNDTTISTPFGPGCWQLLFVDEPAHDEVESRPDSLDTRMQQTWYVNGVLWGTAGTAVSVDGELKAGVAWFAVTPKINGAGKIEGRVAKQGYVALANNNLTMPAIAMTSSGSGAIAFTVTGEDHYPSAGYVRIDAAGNVGPIHLAAVGLGPDDGFTSYKSFVGDPPRTRWGDYGAAVTDGSSIWIASEYIGQTCTLSQFLTGAIGSCGGTRTALGNWYTRLTKLSA
ncbi:MAG: sialidase family protein [Acidimicrobiia bacterium]